MAKKFMYVCLGILALAVAFHLGAQYGQAGYVDHASTGIVGSSGSDVLLADGEVWHRNSRGDAWEQESDLTVPMPVAEIKFWSQHRIVTSSDETWSLEDGSWHNLGTPPGGVSTQPATWSQIKAEFGE